MAKHAAFFSLAMIVATGAMAQGTTSWGGAQPQAELNRLVGQAEFHVREFEREVREQRGGEKMIWRSKDAAMDRVRALKEKYPNDPQVDALFMRVRNALMASKGDYAQIAAEWTAYLSHEGSLRKVMAEAGEAEWAKMLESSKPNMLAKVYPAPDSEQASVGSLRGKVVVLDDVEYPARQFYGASGEYVACGKPSQGFYFVKTSGRDWLDLYEAVKRYRRTVDSDMAAVAKWVVLGEITGIAEENPDSSEDGVGGLRYGWVVRPVALKVPGRVVAAGGKFLGEEKVDSIKNGWYTVKDIPPDVTPDRLMEIFMTAIKEKNYPLYCACVDPERQKTRVAEDLLRYHWDLHQERFHGEYVHAVFGKPKITVAKGFDDKNAKENFFLSDSQKDVLRRRGGTKVENAIVESKAYDADGKQIGTPHPHKLVRRNGGRWYVDEYEPRF